jgi:putative spermidine/putrescine transport system ATP-binding protein
MGFRTRVPGRVVAVSGDEAEIEVAGARLTGTMRDAAQGRRCRHLSVRPEDLVASDQGMPPRSSSMEYRGRAFFGLARTGWVRSLFPGRTGAAPRCCRRRLQPVAGRALLFKGHGHDERAVAAHPACRARSRWHDAC